MHLGLGTRLVSGLVPGRLAALLAALLACTPATMAQEEDDSRCGRYDSLSGPAGTSPPWHVARACLRELRKGGANDPGRGGSDRPGDAVRDFVLKVFAAPDVRFYDGTHPQGLPSSAVLAPDGTIRQDFDRVAQVSGAGQPYNGMGHTGLGVMLYGLAERAQRQGGARAEADARLYRKLARAAFNTALLPTRENGLAESAPCDRDRTQTCTWFYSVTNRNTPTGSGATLNQHLHMVRDSGNAAHVVRKNVWESGDDYDQAFRAGLNQLFLSEGHTQAGKPPNLSDFMPMRTDKVGAHWAFYGFNPTKAPPGGGYYLKDNSRNCHYNVHSLDLIGTVIVRFSRAQQSSPALEASIKTCSSDLMSFYTSSRLRAEAVGSNDSVNQKAEQESICARKILHAENQPSISFIDNMYNKCTKR